MKGPVKVWSPGGNRIFTILREGKTRNCVGLTPVENVPLDLRHGPTMKCAKPSATLTLHRRFLAEGDVTAEQEGTYSDHSQQATDQAFVEVMLMVFARF